MGIATSGGEEPRPRVEARPEGQGASSAAARQADARAPQPAHFVRQSGVVTDW